MTFIPKFKAFWWSSIKMSILLPFMAPPVSSASNIPIPSRYISVPKGMTAGSVAAVFWGWASLPLLVMPSVLPQHR